MINKIKENKLRTICMGLSAFLFGFITVTLFNNINDTYAVNTDPVCPAGWQAPISDVNAKYCCPKNFTYNSSNGKCLSNQYMTKSDCINNYSGEAISDGINQYFHCVVDKKYREAPACYKCNSSTYVWGNYSQNKACSKTTLTYDNCKEPESSCWRCDVGNQYVWSSSQPSTTCSGGSWYKSNAITKKENCVAPTYSCWRCDVGNQYVWSSSQPSTTCSGGNWYKSSTITSAAKCVAPTTTTYTVTFYANGGTFSTGKDSWTKTVYSGARNYFSQMGIPTLTKSGCTADGWYMTNDSGTVYRQYFDTGDATKFYAHWSCSSSGGETGGGETPTPITYTVKYDANGGTGAPSNQTKKQGESLTISTAKPTKTGYTFTSWNTKKDGTGTKYDIGASYTADADLTLYAQYKENTVTYTIKYDANGGTNAPKNQIKNKGINLALSTTKPTKTGYTFTSWNTKKDGTGTKYDIGASYTADADLTLYAQYKENTVTYTIKYDANGGENAPKEQTKTKGKELVLSATMPTKEGYKFVNWNTKKDGTGTSYNAGAKYTTEASITLYAQYEKELVEEETKYTITFYTNDGTTEKSTKVVNKGNKIVKPENPVREGYTFDGWYDKKENGKEYDFTKEVTSDISLYAYWSKIGDKTNEDVDKNSKTGDVLIFIAWTAGIGALAYSVYYFKSRKENI